jgi:hypothetical protein
MWRSGCGRDGLPGDIREPERHAQKISTPHLSSIFPSPQPETKLLKLISYFDDADGGARCTQWHGACFETPEMVAACNAS